MKKFLSLLAFILASGGATFASQAERQIPGNFRGNWIDTTTNLWTLSLQEGFAAADASFWDYEKWSGNGKSARATLRKADGTRRTFRFELQNDSTMVVTDAAGKHILLRESLTTAARPFTAPPDTTSFRFRPWVNDSIRVEGFITGYKPGDAVYHYWLSDLFGFESPNTPMNTDSLGRFRVSIPSTHEQIHIVGTDIAAGPGDRIFIGYSSEGERHLFMGDNARVNQELDRNRPSSVSRRFLPPPDPNERVSDAMSWRFARISAQNMALAAVEKYCREHHLSRKTEQSYRARILAGNIMLISIMPFKQSRPMNFPYAYFQSREGVNLADPELFLNHENSILHYLLLGIWQSYESTYIIDKAGLSGRDAETFSMGGRFRVADPDRFNDFLIRNQPRIDSIFRTITTETRLQWVAPILDSLIPEPGVNRDAVFAHSWGTLWSYLEEPLSGKSLALIDSILRDAPFLRDTLRGLNERYRMLVRQNAALEIPMGTVDSTLAQADSIINTIIRPYAGKVVYVVLTEPGNPGEDTELDHLPAIREKLADKEVEFVFISAALYPQKWRNTVAKYGLTTAKDRHFKPMRWQMGTLVQKYANSGMPAFFLFDRTGMMTASPAPKPSEGDKLFEKIDELLAR